jgi:hypothetical protein
MTRLAFQGLVPYPVEDRVDDWGLTPEQQVGTGPARGRGGGGGGGAAAARALLRCCSARARACAAGRRRGRRRRGLAAPRWGARRGAGGVAGARQRGRSDQSGGLGLGAAAGPPAGRARAPAAAPGDAPAPRGLTRPPALGAARLQETHVEQFRQLLESRNCWRREDHGAWGRRVWQRPQGVAARAGAGHPGALPHHAPPPVPPPRPAAPARRLLHAAALPARPQLRARQGTQDVVRHAGVAARV